MDAAQAHRKIELQAPEDLSYLVANVRRAAAARIDEAFPPVDGDGAAHGEEDELRTRIEELVNEYIEKTFALASPNLSINGLPVDASQYVQPSTNSGSGSGKGGNPEPEVVYEPFDGRKRARVEDLTREEEDLLREIARLKRGVPASCAAAWADAARRQVRDDEDALAAVNESVSRGTGDADGDASVGAGVDLPPLDRQADVETSYAAAVDGLRRLRRDMPAVVARMERARAAGEYVVTER